KQPFGAKARSGHTEQHDRQTSVNRPREAQVQRIESDELAADNDREEREETEVPELFPIRRDQCEERPFGAILPDRFARDHPDLGETNPRGADRASLELPAVASVAVPSTDAAIRTRSGRSSLSSGSAVSRRACRLS